MLPQSQLVFDGPLTVHYGQAYVLSPGCSDVLPEDAFANQRNGLCGSAVKGALFLVTGLHSGQVHLRVESHITPPASDDAWEEVVETSCTFSRLPIILEDWDGNRVCELPLAVGAYRVRYCAKNFGQAPQGNGEDGEPLVESYLLALWPTDVSPDEVVKQTSQAAAYWNSRPWGANKKS